MKLRSVSHDFHYSNQHTLRLSAIFCSSLSFSLIPLSKKNPFISQVLNLNLQCKHIVGSLLKLAYNPLSVDKSTLRYDWWRDGIPVSPSITNECASLPGPPEDRGHFKPAWPCLTDGMRLWVECASKGRCPCRVSPGKVSKLRQEPVGGFLVKPVFSSEVRSI